MILFIAPSFAQDLQTTYKNLAALEKEIAKEAESIKAVNRQIKEIDLFKKDKSVIGKKKHLTNFEYFALLSDLRGIHSKNLTKFTTAYKRLTVDFENAKELKVDEALKVIQARQNLLLPLTDLQISEAELSILTKQLADKIEQTALGGSIKAMQSKLLSSKAFCEAVKTSSQNADCSTPTVIEGKKLRSSLNHPR